MPVFDLCSKDLVYIEEQSSLKQAAQLMKKHNVGGVIVVDTYAGKKPVGIITDRDIALCCVDEKLSLTKKIQKVMTKKIVTMPRDAGIAAVVEKMEKDKVRKIIILDKQGHACGLVSSDDILELLAREINALGKVSQIQNQNGKSYKAQSWIG